MNPRIKLWKPVQCGTKRKLSPSECAQFSGTSLRPNPGPNWALVRDDLGQISLLYQDKGGGALWPLEEAI